LNILDIRNVGSTRVLGDMLQQFQECLDLESGPMFAMAYLHGYDDGSARMWFAIHHLIVDTVSWRFLIRDLENLYNGRELGQKQTSYRQWTQAVRDYPFTEDEKSYWENIRQKAAVANGNLPAP